MMNFFKKYWGLFAVFAVCFLAARSMFLDGFFPVHDDVQPTRIFQMSQSIIDGMFPVRWVSDLGFGYGYPIFNFYAPLPYYTGAVFYLIGVDAITAAKIMFTIPVFVAGAGMYFFIRSFLGQKPAIISAIIYVLFPYFALNIFIRGAVGEYYAYSFLPYIFWGLFGLFYSMRNRRDKQKIYLKPVTISAIFLSGLIISHNLSAYMALIFIFIYSLAAIFLINNKKIFFINLLTILALSFLLSSFYTLPAVFEIRYTDVRSQLDGNFDFSKHYVCPIQWWDSPWGFAGSSEGCLEDGISFRLGKSNIIIAILGIAAFVLLAKKTKNRKYYFLFLYSLTLLALSLFMTTEYSYFIWSNLPEIEFLQFPWRFLNFAGFAIAALGGYLIYMINNKNRKAGLVVLIFAVFLTLYLNLKLFQPQVYLNRSADYYTKTENISFLHSKLTNEYMPPNFVRPGNENEVPKKPFEIPAGMGSVEIIENKTTRVSANIEMNREDSLKINKAFFPAWKLYANRTEIKLSEDKKGMIARLDKGSHYVALEFESTPIQILGNSLTISGIIILLAVIIKSGKYKNYDKEN